MEKHITDKSHIKTPGYRRAASPARRGSLAGNRTRAGKISGTDKRLIQFLACVFIFSVVAIVKTVYPAGGEVIRQAMFGSVINIDYKGAVEALGRAMVGEGSITEVFGYFSPEEEEQEVGGVQNGVNEDDDTVQSGVTPSEEDEVFDRQGETDDISAQRTGLTSRSGENRLPTRQQQTELTSYIEDLSFELSEADLSDDTSPNPFLIPTPDRVDMETKQFAFEYTTPIYGPVTSPFGYRDHPIDGDTKFHYGIDIGADYGLGISSFADGIVDAVGVSEIYGNYIKVLHSDGVLSFYGHCSKINYKIGAKVKMGDIIAQIGSTGVSTGPHLHFEVRLGDSILDPTPYINPEGI